MSIQGNVNQIISLTALLATQTPQYKAQAEKRTQLGQIKQEEKVLGKREAVAQAKGGSTYNIKKEQAELAYRKYRTNPSVKTAEEAMKAEEVAEEARLKEPSDEPEMFANMEEQEAHQLAQEQQYEEMLAERENPPQEEKVENWETFEKKAQEADARTAEAQNAKRATLTRKKGLVKQSYGRSGLGAGRDGRVKFSLDVGGNK